MKRYRSRGGRRRRVRRKMIVYRNPFPDVERIQHKYFNVHPITGINTASGDFLAFGHVFQMNNPSDPNQNDGGGTSGDRARNAQAIGFDRYAPNYDAFYVPHSSVTFHFRRNLNEAADNFIGYVGYYYFSGNDGTPTTTLSGIINGHAMGVHNRGAGLSAFLNTPGVVWRRFGINDGEHGLKMHFGYNRSSFFRDIDVDHTFTKAVGQITGTTVTNPVEKAYICPFIMIEHNTTDNTDTEQSYTETTPYLNCEVSIVYNVLWSDLKIDKIRDTTDYNEA